MKTEAAQVDRCKKLGARAFHLGQPCVPSLDQSMMAIIRGRQVGDDRTIAELTAWLDGWQEANMQKPVELYEMPSGLGGKFTVQVLEERGEKVRVSVYMPLNPDFHGSNFMTEKFLLEAAS